LSKKIGSIFQKSIGKNEKIVGKNNQWKLSDLPSKNFCKMLNKDDEKMGVLEKQQLKQNVKLLK